MQNKMRVLITGGTGLLGRSLLKIAPQKYKVYSTYFDASEQKRRNMIFMDLRDKEQVKKAFGLSLPQLVIHTSGIGTVDFVEKNKSLAYEVNVKGTEYIINECKKYGTKIIYISSNAVFDGKSPPYSEDSKLTPINHYGEQKVESERLIKTAFNYYTIVRPILMYGWNDNYERLNPVTWELRELKTNKQIYIVNDVWTQPLYSISCAETIWKLIELNKDGIWHIAGKDIITRYDFALQIAEIFGLNRDLISPVNSDFFKEIAKRPENTSYLTSKVERELKIKLIGVKEGLKNMMKTVF